MRKLVLLVFAIATAGLVLAGVSLARGGDDDKGRTSTRLDGYQETPLTISTKGKGTFEARIGSSVIEYTLRYEGLEELASSTGVTLARTSSGSFPPFSASLDRLFRIVSSARSAAPGTESCTETCRSEAATTWAIPAPIWPAPTTPIFSTAIWIAFTCSRVWTVLRPARGES